MGKRKVNVTMKKKRQAARGYGKHQQEFLTRDCTSLCANGLKIDWPNSEENGFKITEFLNLISNFCLENAIK